MLAIFKLMLIFAKVGILTIGGGMVMLPLIRTEMLKHEWLTEAQFIDILGISEATPGPMALNCATFVGWRVAGIPGSLVATISIGIPAFLCVMVFGMIWRRYRKHPGMARLMKFLRTVMSALILTFAMQLGRVILGEAARAANWWDLAYPVLVTVVVMLIVLRGKISPVAALLGGAVVGAGFSLL